MHSLSSGPVLGCVLVVLLITSDAAPQEKAKPFKIAPANLKDQIIWGSTCEGPDGFVLGFGGQDQKSDDLPRTGIKVDGQWQSMTKELRKENPLQKLHGFAREFAQRRQAELAVVRALFFEGLPAAEEAKKHYRP